MPLPADKIKNETLLVSGCSYTIKDYYNGFIPGTNPPVKDIIHSNTWTTMLGFKKVINMAENGDGNDIIINKCIEHLLDDRKQDPDRIIIALTNWDRFCTPYSTYTPGVFMWFTPKEFKRHQPGGDKEATTPGMKREIEWHKKWGNPNSFTFSNMIGNTIRSIIILHELCLKRGIPCHVFQLLDPWTWPDNPESLKLFGDPNKMVFNEFFNHPLANKFANLKNIDMVGYPFEKTWGGYQFWRDICIENLEDYQSGKLRISKEDGHPSPYGHILIAKKVLAELNYFELKIKNNREFNRRVY